jgi:hypothetical protein
VHSIDRQKIIVYGKTIKRVFSLTEMSKVLPTSWDEQVIFDEMMILSANLDHSA